VRLAAARPPGRPAHAADVSGVFRPDEFPRFVPWLMLNRNGLAVLIHPNTGRSKSDHLVHALWLGEVLALNAAPLSDEHDDIDAEVVANTEPTVRP
jgi:aromatic ring-cleaving dioxygenase